MKLNLTKLEKEVPFDQFSRQYQVRQILGNLRRSNQKFKILDVGGYLGRTQDFLVEDEVTVVDLYDVKEKNYVKGSALDLPFSADSFDFVLSFDVLEHIPAEYRKKFADECIRVAIRGVIVCAPNKNELNEMTESKLNDLYKRLHRKPHRWLKEHIEYRIPDFDVTDTYFTSKGLFTTRFYSNKAQLWFAMQQAIFINSKFPLASEKLVELNKFYNQNFKYDGGGSSNLSYRQILCAFNSKTDALKLTKTMNNLNAPIEPMLELKLTEIIGDYYSLLLQKTSQLASNYSNLLEHQQKENAILLGQREVLMRKVKTYEKILPVKALRKVTMKLRGSH